MTFATNTIGFDIHPRLGSASDESNYSSFMREISREFGMEDSDEGVVLVPTTVGPYLQFVGHENLVIPSVGKYECFLRFSYSFSTAVVAGALAPVDSPADAAAVTQSASKGDGGEAVVSRLSKFDGGRLPTDVDMTFRHVMMIAEENFGGGRIKMWREGGGQVGRKSYTDCQVALAEQAFGKGKETDMIAEDEDW